MPSYKKSFKVPGKGAKELYDIISTEIDKFLKKTPIGDFKLECVESAKQFKVKSSMFSAVLTCSDGNLDLDGQLSLFAAPFKSKIDDGIDRWLSKTFKT
jgi:hypothetical protein